MSKHQSGFALPEIVITLVIFVLVGAAGAYIWFHKNHSSQNGSINEINSLLEAAHIPQFNEWQVNAHCGPTDAFLGYELVPQKMEQPLSDEQFSKLKSIALARNLSVGGYGPGGYKIEGTGWSVSVYTDEKGHNPTVGGEVFSNYKPKGFPDGSLVCG